MLETLLYFEANKIKNGPLVGFLWGVLNGAGLPILAVVIYELAKLVSWIEPYVFYIAVLGAFHFLLNNWWGLSAFYKIKDRLAPEAISRIFPVYIGAVISTVFIGIPILFGYTARAAVEFYSLDWFGSPQPTSLKQWFLFGLTPITSGLTLGGIDIFGYRLTEIQPVTASGRSIYAIYSAVTAFVFLSALVQVIGEVNRRHVQLEKRTSIFLLKLPAILASVGGLFIICALLVIYFSMSLNPRIVLFVESTWFVGVIMMMVALWIWWFLKFTKAWLKD